MNTRHRKMLYQFGGVLAIGGLMALTGCDDHPADQPPLPGQQPVQQQELTPDQQHTLPGLTPGQQQQRDERESMPPLPGEQSQN